MDTIVLQPDYPYNKIDSCSSSHNKAHFMCATKGTKMKITIIYPSDFFDIKKVDPDYLYEYQEAVKFPEIQIVFYNYDDFVSEAPLRLYPGQLEPGLGIYRGWMLQTEKYRQLYEALLDRGVTLINQPEQYQHAHEFPYAYPVIKDYTPKTIVCPNDQPINWDQVRAELPRFMIKDFVKSVKGTEFPVMFDNTYSNQELDQYVKRFIELRGQLFTGGIVLKEFVDLKSSGGKTNEYRAFYLDGQLLTMSKNSNQNSDVRVPELLLQSLPSLKSRFYTVDFAELADGGWTVIETGDGQVSGLSPGQYVFKFYEQLIKCCQ